MLASSRNGRQLILRVTTDVPSGGLKTSLDVENFVCYILNYVCAAIMNYLVTRFLCRWLTK